MKNRKLLTLQFHKNWGQKICYFFFACLIVGTFTACDKGGVNAADAPAEMNKITQETGSDKNSQESVGKESTQDTASDKTNQKAAAEQTSQQTATEQTAQEATYEQITQEEAKSLMDTEPDAIILDVRTEEEYAAGHIVGAICIPNETIDETVTSQLPDKAQLILIYCRSGNRSKQASEKLVDLGYTNIKEFGGINSWPYEAE